MSMQPLVAAEGTPILVRGQVRRVFPTRVAIVGNYLPRQCGIATFTTDLCEALSAEYDAIQLLAVPVNDTEAGYNYPARVRFELSEGSEFSYQQAAAFLNESSVDQCARL